MTKTLALGAASATALARSRTMLALVLNRSCRHVSTPSIDQIMSLFTITSHSRFPGNTSWDKYNLSATQSLLQAGRSWIIALDSALCVDVADISCDTWSFHLYQYDLFSSTSCGPTDLGLDGYRRELVERRGDSTSSTGTRAGRCHQRHRGQ